MKRLILALIALTLFTGCAVVPLGHYRGHGPSYHHYNSHGYHRGY